jgi:hypothetical protein
MNHGRIKNIKNRFIKLFCSIFLIFTLLVGSVLVTYAKYVTNSDGSAYTSSRHEYASVFTLPSESVNGQADIGFSGNTLTNLLGCSNNFYKYGTLTSSFNDGTMNSLSNTYHMVTSASGEGYMGIPCNNLKKDKKYILRADVKINSVSGGAQRIKLATTPEDIALDLLICSNNSKIGTYQTILTLLKPNSDGNRTVILGTCYSGGIFAQIDFDLKNLALYEISNEDYTEKDIGSLMVKYPFVSGSKPVQAIRVKSTGRNLINAPNQQILADGTTSSVSMLVGYVKVKKNTNYSFHCECSKKTGYINTGCGGFCIVGSYAQPKPVLKEWFISSYDHLLITESASVNENYTVNSGEYQYLGIYVGVCGTLTTVFDIKNISCVEGSSALPNYVKYMESTSYIPSNTHLQSNGDIFDELDLTKGEYTRRIGDDGSVLSQTEISNINSTSLKCFAGGTIIIDNAIKEVGVYANELEIENNHFPIETVECLYKIEGKLKKTIGLNNINVASDGLTFTITNAKSGDRYEYVYTYSSSLSAPPVVTVSAPVNTQAQIEDSLNMIKRQAELISNMEERLKYMESRNQVLRTNTGPIKVNCTSEKTFTLALSASNIKDFSSRSFKVIYNSKELDVVDLCAATPTLENSVCNVSGTNITVTNVEPGVIEFMVYYPVEQRNNWSGAVNAIVFLPKITGQTTVSYISQ